MTTATKSAAGNLPVILTSFIGRRSEIADVKQALAQSRLVTLVGPGGVGKTRLAIHTAEEVRRAFPDGAWFVDLSPLQDEDLLVSTVARALRLQSRSRSWGPAALARHLADLELLVVLDNCEHVRDACAVLVDALLRACPSLRVLVDKQAASGDLGGASRGSAAACDPRNGRPTLSSVAREVRRGRAVHRAGTGCRFGFSHQ